MLKANGSKARNCFFWLSLPLASQCQKIIEELWSLTKYNSNNNNDDNYNNKDNKVNNKKKKKKKKKK